MIRLSSQIRCRRLSGYCVISNSNADLQLLILSLNHNDLVIYIISDTPHSRFSSWNARGLYAFYQIRSRQTYSQAWGLLIFISVTFLILANTLSNKTDTQHKEKVLVRFSRAFILTTTKRRVVKHGKPHSLTSVWSVRKLNYLNLMWLSR